MGLTLSIRADEGLLYATYSGAFSLAEAKSTFVQIIEAVYRNKIQKVVVDGRKITGEPSMMERFLYGEFAAKLCRTMRHVPQFAYILIPPVLDPKRLGETVAVNRGMFVKAFDNLHDGLKWLGVDSGSLSASAGSSFLGASREPLPDEPALPQA